MGERRRRTLGERGAQPDPVRNVSFGLPDDPQRDTEIARRVRLAKLRKPTRCRCGIELPRTGKCDYCD